MLVKAGADAGATTKDGIGSLALVRAVDQKKMLKFLREKGKTKKGDSLPMTTARKLPKDYAHVKPLNFAKQFRQSGFQPRPHLGFQPIPLSFSVVIRAENHMNISAAVLCPR